MITWNEKTRKRIMEKTYHLSDLIDPCYYERILIDGEILPDRNGCYPVNVGYIRVSTDKQAEEGFGLDIQEKAIRNWCCKNDLNNLLLFTDDGYTGTSMDRPALQGIMSYIEDYNAGESRIRINCMIVPRIDRLSRTLLGTLTFIQDYMVAKSDSKNSPVNGNREDIEFISIAENYCRIERNNPQGKFMLMFFAGLAEFDRDLIVEKLQAGRTARVASGKWMGGGNPPYGYRYDRDEGILKIVPEEAEKVREVFRLYIEENMSPAKIASLLGFKGERIVAQILRRKSLTGCILYRGVEYEGQHEAVIPLERWQEAQDEIEKRSVVRGESDYLLSGLLYCAECGAKMRYQKWGGSGECKLVCYSRQKSKPNLVKDENCQNRLFWQNEIESAVIEEIFSLSYIPDREKEKGKELIDPAEALSRQITEQKKKLSRLLDFEDDMEDDVLTEKIMNCRKRIRELEAKLKSENEQKNLRRRIERAKILLSDLRESWEFMGQKERQSVCRELIEKVVISKDGRTEVFLRLREYLKMRGEE